MHRHCRQINAGELREVLRAIKEPVKSPAGGKELREAFDTFIRTIEHGKIGRRQMNVTSQWTQGHPVGAEVGVVSKRKTHRRIGKSSEW